jgi:hypothetical protein
VLCLEDCLALCDLTEEEVLAIAHHEHIPEIAAAEFGNYLTRTPEGEFYIKAMIRDDIAAASARGDRLRRGTQSAWPAGSLTTAEGAAAGTAGRRRAVPAGLPSRLCLRARVHG